MKSIMQEASSVIKAIEKGWETAGKPKQFSITVFEEPKKNFIGMTVQSAKVGIFFDEAKAVERELPKTTHIKKKEPFVKPQPKKEFVQQQEKEEKPEVVEKSSVKAQARPVQKAQPRELPTAQPKLVWTPEMISFVQQWLTQTLAALNLSHISFTTEPSNYQLVINFNKPLLAQAGKEQQLMKSFSLLLIQTLRHTFKRPLRGFKIMMTHTS